MPHIKSLLVGCLLVQCMVVCHAQLDASEITALTAFYNEFSDTLTDLAYAFPIWTSSVSQACGSGPSTAFAGVFCSNGHIHSLAFNRIPLAGTIPREIAGLVYLNALYDSLPLYYTEYILFFAIPTNKSIETPIEGHGIERMKRNLADAGLIGTIPVEMAQMTNLTILNLRSNSVNLCGAQESLPSSLNTCDVRDQGRLLCGLNCCGCNLNYTTVPCQSNVPECGQNDCAFPAPQGPSGSICEDGRWYILDSYTGSLVVEGSVTLLGNLEVPVEHPLVFVGFDSFLAVQGSVSIKGHVIVSVNEEERKSLKLYRGIRTYAYVYTDFMVSTLPSLTTPRAALVQAHSQRSCNRPRTIMQGTDTLWTIGLQFRDTCNVWWIILLCLGIPLLIAFVGFFISSL